MRCWGYEAGVKRISYSLSSIVFYIIEELNKSFNVYMCKELNIIKNRMSVVVGNYIGVLRYRRIVVQVGRLSPPLSSVIATILNTT